MTEKEKAEAGYLFNANYNPEIDAITARCNDLCHAFNQLRPITEADKRHYPVCPEDL